MSCCDKTFIVCDTHQCSDIVLPTSNLILSGSDLVISLHNSVYTYSYNYSHSNGNDIVIPSCTIAAGEYTTELWGVGGEKYCFVIRIIPIKNKVCV